MSNKKTILINLIAGPCAGKTTICALLFAKLKLLGHVVEYVQEYAKHLVWKKNYELLNNQYYVTQTQANLMENMVGSVDYIITDGSILHGLYYNRHNKNNICNIEKTEKFILDKYNSFDNINIFLERGNHKYETQGRIQTEDEAKEIDIILKHLLKQSSIDFKLFKSDVDDNNLNNMIDHILSSKNTINKTNDTQIYIQNQNITNDKSL